MIPKQKLIEYSETVRRKQKIDDCLDFIKTALINKGEDIVISEIVMNAINYRLTTLRGAFEKFEGML